MTTPLTVLPPIDVPASAPLMIVLNAGSGRRDAAQTQKIIEQELTQAGRAHQLFLIEKTADIDQVAQHAVQQAKIHHGVVVAAGGDGTINAVAQAVLGSGCPFGVMPQGTFNYFSRTHSIPAQTEASLKILLSAKAYPIQVGQVNDHVFLVNASLGLYPKILEEREVYKQRFKRSRFVAGLAALVTLLRDHRKLHLKIEEGGQTRIMSAFTLFVGNNRLQLEQIGIQEAPLLEADHLAAVTLKPVGRLTLLWLLLCGAWGHLGDSDKVDSFAFQRITVSPGQNSKRTKKRWVKMAIDGEILRLRTPIEFRVASQSLYLLKPDPAVTQNRDPESAEFRASRLEENA